MVRQPNFRWVRLGCNLLTTLLASPDGVRFLMTEDDFLDQIVKSFAQLDPVRVLFSTVHCANPKRQFNPTPESDPIFSKARISETLTYGYFEMLGTLSKHPDGLEYVRGIRMTSLLTQSTGSWRSQRSLLLSTILASSGIVKIS